MAAVRKQLCTMPGYWPLPPATAAGPFDKGAPGCVVAVAVAAASSGNSNGGDVGGFSADDVVVIDLEERMSEVRWKHNDDHR